MVGQEPPEVFGTWKEAVTQLKGPEPNLKGSWLQADVTNVISDSIIDRNGQLETEPGRTRELSACSSENTAANMAGTLPASRLATDFNALMMSSRSSPWVCLLTSLATSTSLSACKRVIWSAIASDGVANPVTQLSHQNRAFVRCSLIVARSRDHRQGRRAQHHN
jgi:hypothetical protein